MDSEKKKEYTRRVAQANSTEMVVIIYDIALDYIDEAKRAFSSDTADEEGFHKAIGCIQGCIAELIESLHYEYSPAKELRSLYNFCLRRIAVSEAKKDPGILDEVVKVLKPLRDAYDQISGENKNGPVMGNSQTVYAGLTYGREELIENLSTNANRGYLV